MRIMILLASLLILPASGWAAPISVTLFPDSGQIEERAAIRTESIEQGLHQCTVVLPGQADPSSVRLSHLPEGTVVSDVSWSSREEQNQAALTALNARLHELLAVQDRLTAEAEGLRGRLAFWKAQTQPQEQSIPALRELSAELSATLRADTLTLRVAERDRAKVDADIAAVQAQLDQTAGHAKTVWDVRVLFTGHAPHEVTYTYSMRDCGWSPLYRLDAQPEHNRIDFSWQAKVWQRSGTDWANARLFLATIQPDVRTVPDDVPPWEITPIIHMPRKAMAAPVMMEAQLDRAGGARAPEAPQEIRRATYALWDMGQRALPAGQTRIFEVRQEQWPATFAHLVRPALSPQSFLQASSTFAQPQELPPGTGYFLVQGAMLDQREFAFSGTNDTLYFGSNPLVTARTITHTKQSGEKGLFGAKRSYAWDWSVIVKNEAGYPIALRVEEPRPLSRDERIQVEVKTEPAPSADPAPDMLVWSSTLQAKGEQRIRITVNLQAPDDLPINLGWRW